MNRSADAPTDIERLRQAGEWVQRLSACADEREFMQWQRWCEAHPANADLFEQMQEVWDGMAPARVARVAAARPARRRLLPAFAAAAALLLAVAAAFWLNVAPPPGPPLELRTDISEIRGEVLSDGSRLELGPDSRVLVRYSDAGRDLDLIDGRVYFDVARDPQRPFTVRAGGLDVTAVGTAFDVRVSGEKTIVAVGAGRVRVAARAGAGGGASPVEPVHLEAGQQVSYSRRARALALDRMDPALAESWRRGILQYQEEPLAEVLEEINRYLPRRIILADPQLGRAPFTGTISPERVEEWLEALERILPVTVEDRGSEGIRIVRGAPSGAH